ncbi:MAG: UbiX family flavin prenyltransferase [Deltaproteobacteria bacterium]|nr:UbiX family flavin prenyltransferase [Deltaproteobacteria bacterium]
MIVVAITGASGPIIGIRLMEELLKGGEAVTGIASKGSLKIMEHEISCPISDSFPLSGILEQRGNVADLTNFREYDNKNFNASCASGTSAFESIVVAPCSMKSLSAIANGYADNLITRACDVALKERKRCIIVPRETPFNLIHLENMRKATLAGAVIAPPIPGFYTMPQTAADIVDFVVGKILNLLGKRHDLFKGWGE